MNCDRNVIKLPAFISYRLKKHVKRLLYTFLYFVDKVYESICGGLSYFILGKGIVGKKNEKLANLVVAKNQTNVYQSLPIFIIS